VIWISCVAAQIAVGIVILLTNIPLTSNTEGINDLDADRGYVISTLVLAVIAAPFVEELLFRGVVLRGLRSALAVVPAVALQAVLFGVAHVDPVRGSGNIGLVLVLAAVGAVLGTAAHLLRRIGPTMLAHAILNAVVMAIVLSG
jgi:membrane protease YdiL (CAAX protease family)